MLEISLENSAITKDLKICFRIEWLCKIKKYINPFACANYIKNLMKVKRILPVDFIAYLCHVQTKDQGRIILNYAEK